MDENEVRDLHKACDWEWPNASNPPLIAVYEIDNICITKSMRYAIRNSHEHGKR